MHKIQYNCMSGGKTGKWELFFSISYIRRQKNKRLILEKKHDVRGIGICIKALFEREGRKSDYFFQPEND